MFKKLFFLLFFLFITYSVCAKDADLLYIGAGINNFRREHSRSTEFRAEYKFHYKWWLLRPLLGASLTTKKQFYGYGGISLDLIIKKYLVLAPNFAAGYYNKGSGKDLGFPLEFRTGIEVAARLNNEVRLGVHVSHTSNASLGRKNPGLETIYFFFAIPTKKYM
jgi:hypothetical protein